MMVGLWFIWAYLFALTCQKKMDAIFAKDLESPPKQNSPGITPGAVSLT